MPEAVSAPCRYRQNRSPVSAGSRDSHPTGPVAVGAQPDSSTVFPQPAGATSTVTGPRVPASSRLCNRGRSTAPPGGGGTASFDVSSGSAATAVATGKVTATSGSCTRTLPTPVQKILATTGLFPAAASQNPAPRQTFTPAGRPPVTRAPPTMNTRRGRPAGAPVARGDGHRIPGGPGRHAQGNRYRSRHHQLAGRGLRGVRAAVASQRRGLGD